MPLRLMLITNNTEVAKIAERYGVDRIFVDLEILGKHDRQKSGKTVISEHSIDDVKEIRNVIKKSDLLVRINSVNPNTVDEINSVIDAGADIIMLPYFRNRNQVELFVKTVNGRCRTCLLAETVDSVENIDDILSVGGIDEVHIGLNDLHLDYKMDFMFEPLSRGIVERLSRVFNSRNIPFGFGGIARLGLGLLLPEYIIPEHYRLGSSMVILSKTFCKPENFSDMYELEETMKVEIKKIRDFESSMNAKDDAFFVENKKIVDKKIEEIVSDIIASEIK